MNPIDSDLRHDDTTLNKHLAALDDATRAMAQTRDFGTQSKGQVLESLRRVLLEPEGCAAVRSRAGALEESGLFLGTDWACPEILVPALSSAGLRGADADTVVMEAASQLRMLAIATSEYSHLRISEQDAHQFVTQMLAMNLALLFTAPSEAEPLGPWAHRGH